MLKFDPRWRFKPPANGRYINTTIPNQAVQEFSQLIQKIAGQGKDRWSVLESFKGAFAAACGNSYSQSSSVDWAESDMLSHMERAGDNAPAFLNAFYEACEELRTSHFFTPDSAMINEICARYNIGYYLQPPDLLLKESLPATAVPEMRSSLTVEESSMKMLGNSLKHSEELLSKGRHREAVQEILWVLESLSTAFRGLKVGDQIVKGKYFSDIVKDLQNLEAASALKQVLSWVNVLYGYLSSPTGGGVRHGVDLNEGTPIGPAEARLYCDLIRSYVNYLIAIHEQMDATQ